MKRKYQKTDGNKIAVGKKRRLIIILTLLAVLTAAIVLSLLMGNNSVAGVPILTVETPKKISAGNDEIITLDVSISDLGDAIYPAMSISLGFDSSRLEFLGVKEGNIFILNDKDDASVAQKLPNWSYNVHQSNETGIINIMYLDMTGGKCAFSKELLAEEDNVVLRLNFRLRGSARAGDILDLILEDAVFAASDETKSLAITMGTLRTRNGKIVIGN